MEIRGLFRNKKGDSVIVETVIFFLLNLVFFILMIMFVLRSGNGAAVYEQAYAKQIALLIDQAKPGMTFVVNMVDGIKIATDNKLDLSKVVTIKDNMVIVSLSSPGGYGQQFYSSGDVRIEKNIDAGGNLVISVNEKDANKK